METLDLRMTVDGHKRGLMEVAPGSFLACTLGFLMVPGAGLEPA